MPGIKAVSDYHKKERIYLCPTVSNYMSDLIIGLFLIIIVANLIIFVLYRQIERITGVERGTA